MGFFRFRRSIKLFPGVRWNIGKKSSSFSFGGRGFHYTIGPRGGRTTVGIPGTGLSYTETSGSSRPSGENSGCAGCLGQIILLLMVLGGISMCVRSDKESSSTNPNPSASPQASATPSAQSDLPSTPAPTAFPDPKYWPKEVRISAPVVLSGTVGGGTIKQTAKPGAVLDASLSADHKSVTLRRLDITGTLPIGDTDFLERAKKSEMGK